MGAVDYCRGRGTVQYSYTGMLKMIATFHPSTAPFHGHDPAPCRTGSTDSKEKQTAYEGYIRVLLPFSLHVFLLTLPLRLDRVSSLLIFVSPQIWKALITLLE